MFNLKNIISLFILFVLFTSNIKGINDYELCIEKLKSWEGFAKTPKLGCIGYGHYILKNEHYSTISLDSANNLLRKDFDRHIRFVRNNTNLNENKLYAVSLLAFNIGVGKVLNEIKEGLLSDYSRSLKYSYYRKKFIPKLYQRRLWEYEFYNK